MSTERVPVSAVLELRRRPVEPLLDEQYVTIGIRSFGHGIFHYEPRQGDELGKLRYFELEPDQLVLSNIKAWEGAVAVSSEADGGLLASNRFLTYAPIDPRRIDVGWARWFFLSEQGNALLQAASPGSADRNRTLGRERFESLQIPLPPIDHQQAVAAKLDRVESVASKAGQRSREAEMLTSAFGASIASRPDLSEVEKTRRGWHLVELGSVMEQRQDHVEVKAIDSYPNVGIYSFGKGLFAKPPIDGDKTSAKVLNRLHSDQFIYSRLFAFEGAYAFVGEEFEGRFVSNEFPTFDVDPRRLDAGWLAAYLRSPDRWSELSGKSVGLGVRRQRVPVKSVLGYSVWLPPIGEQRGTAAVVSELDETRAKRAASNQLIDAITPAVLNETFGGVG